LSGLVLSITLSEKIRKRKPADLLSIFTFTLRTKIRNGILFFSHRYQADAKGLFARDGITASAPPLTVNTAVCRKPGDE
jgi:hypothetical protein